MSDKICVVTGATSGIGAATAEALAKRGATVVLVGRNQEKCAATVDRIRCGIGNPSVEYAVADLSSQAEIRHLARLLRERYRRLDVLVNNAGGFFWRRRLSVDGIEMTFALNHLGYFQLTNLLLDMLLARAPARIVNVSSIVHELAKGINFNDLQYRRGYCGFRAYYQSKLANLLFTLELARRLEGTGVTANALHPGFAETNIGRSNGWLWRLVRPLIERMYRIKFISAEEAARTVIYLATSPDVASVTGLYYAEERPATPSEVTRDRDAARRLWQISEEMTALPEAASMRPMS